jgi:outer membrane receptor protein involved in Fe transport
MSFKQKQTSLQLLTLALCGSAAGLSSAAQLDEIIVTAQKRAQSLQDVPISVAVATGERLEHYAVNGMEELSASMPNVHIGENATQDSVTIRGIGSGANQGFEQSVGTFVDGVYFGRGRSSRAPFLDAERVEVLKGPQGVLFGKNTIAGALNITTRLPGDEFEGSVQAEYFDGTETTAVTAVLSGPLSERLAARVVARYSDMQGYVYNFANNSDEPSEREQLVRATLVYAVNEDLELVAKLERSSFDQDGRTFQLARAGAGYFTAAPPSGIGLNIYDPNYEAELDYRRSVNSAAFGDEYDNTDAENFTLTARYQLHNAQLVSVTSQVGYDYSNLVGGHFIANVDLGVKMYQEELTQRSQELRLESDLDGNWQYVAGLFYQTERIDHHQDFAFNTSFIFAEGAPGVPPWNGARVFELEQDIDSLGLFLQSSWQLSEQLSATLGLRYTRDEKELSFARYRDGVVGWPGGDSLGDFAVERSRTDSDVTPSFNLQWQPNDDVMLYVTLAQGFKSGGFDFETAKEFEEETVDAIELGVKSTLRDGSLELNAALFRSEFTDLQTAAWVIDHFETGNAGKSLTQGLEVDFRWQLSAAVNLSGSLALLDAKFDEFRDGYCSGWGARNGVCSASLTYDQTGDPLQFAPDYSGSLNIEYVTFVGALELSAALGVDFTDAYYTAADLDPVSEQAAFAKLNARIELASNDGWSLALVGKNLTDKETTTWVNDHPVFNAAALEAYFASIDPPRSLGLQAKYNF